MRFECALWAATMVATGLALAAEPAVDRRAVDAHVAAARTAAGQEHTALFDLLCTPRAPRATTAPQPAGAVPAGPPGRALWHAEPVKVFDNLYFVGMSNYSAWAVTTSAGIIIIDALLEYSVEDEIVDGLEKLGLNPSDIKYVIVSHGHFDHVAGARYLQDRYRARVVMSAEDWDLLDRMTPAWPKPRRDMVASDGQRFTLGDTTITMYVTPGHTLGTLSMLIPVRDGTRTHLAAEFGGTYFNWLGDRASYIIPGRDDRFWFDTYIRSSERFRDIVAKSGADVLLANHVDFDGSKAKLPLLAGRKATDPHPYVIGSERVRNYMTVATECAKAGLLRIN